MPKRSKKLNKLRHYRDKLLARIVLLEKEARIHMEMFRMIRKTLSEAKGSGAVGDQTLRVYAIAGQGIDGEISEDTISLGFIDKNDAIAELTLVYKMLAVERKYTHDIGHAVRSRDLLRIAALAADHTAEQIAHDKMLSTWSKDHGFTKSLRDECRIY